MSTLRTLVVGALAGALAAGCAEQPTAPESNSPMIASAPVDAVLPGSLDVQASADPDCVWEKGQEFFVPVPVNDTDFVLADVRMRQATCLIRPNGSRLFRIVHEVVSDIPLPQSKLTLRGFGPDGELQEYNLFFGDELIFSGPFPCGWIEPDVEPTFDWEFSVTPGGINISTCRWEAE